MTNPVISVVMPVYNAEKYVAESIESILNQTYSDFEFIIIDDCSTDSSYKILERYAKQDTRIRLFRNDVNSKLPKTLNFGVAQATGKYIARMDADDISLPERFAKQIEFMESNSDVDLCGTFLRTFACGSQKYKNITYPIEHDDIVIELLFVRSSIAHATVFIKRDCFIKYNISYDENLGGDAEDYDLWNRLIECNLEFHNIPQFLYLYRQYNTQTTSLSNEKIKNTTNRLINNNLYKYFGDYISEEYLSKYMKYKFMRKKDMTLAQAIDYLKVVKIILSASNKYNLFDKRKLSKALNDRLYMNIIKRLQYAIFCIKK